MIKNYLIIIYRNIMRYRLYAAINLFALALGICIFIVSFIYVQFNVNFERWIPSAQQIYIMRTRILNEPPSNLTMGHLLEEMRLDYPNIIGTRIRYQKGTIRRINVSTDETINEVDPEFFRVFDLPLAAGHAATALNQPSSLLISQKKAIQYFGREDVLGRSLTLEFNDEIHLYRITGIIKNTPENTDLVLNFLVPINRPSPTESGSWSYWGETQVYTYLKLKTPGQLQTLNADLGRFADKYGAKDHGPEAHKFVSVQAFPLLSVHLAEPADLASVAALGLVGFLTLILAAMNYVNLATARAGLRAREVAVRKVLGATRNVLFWQFIIEAFLTTTVAALMGLAICELSLPLINTVSGLTLRMGFEANYNLAIILVLVIICICIGAGAYPAVIISRFKPAVILAATQSPETGRAGFKIREGLIGLQFLVSTTFMMATLVIIGQMAFLKHVSLGFNRSNLIIVKSFNHDGMTKSQHMQLLSAWRAIPGVLSLTDSASVPGIVSDAVGKMKRPNTVNESVDVHYEMIGPEFKKTYEPTLIAGRWLDLRHGSDIFDPQGASAERGALIIPNVVLNEKASHDLGFSSAKDALGKLIEANDYTGRYQIVGVIKDIKFGSPHKLIKGALYLQIISGIPNSTSTIRYSGNFHDMINHISYEWNRIVPTEPFLAETTEEALVPFYQKDEHDDHLFMIAAAVAIAISCVGLCGLTSFNTNRRVKEIGIRKALGASTADIVKLLLKQILRPVVIASVLAWPLSWWAMQVWLNGFNQRIELNPVYFLSAILINFSVALVTVFAQVFSLARSEPAKALRYF